jgi:hypothetical protein
MAFPMQTSHFHHALNTVGCVHRRFIYNPYTYNELRSDMGAGKIDAYLRCISAYNVQGPLRQDAFDLTAIPDYINENCNKIKPVVFFLEKQQVTVPLQPLSALFRWQVHDMLFIVCR